MFGLSKILTKEIILKQIKEQDGSYLTFFSENSSNSKVRKVKFYGFHNRDFFAFSLDYDKKKVSCKKSYQRLSMCLNIKHKKINKKSDVIFALKDNQVLYFFIIDIKSSKYKDKDTECQLHNSELFINYLITLIKEYGSENITNVKFIRCVFFPELPLAKSIITKGKNKGGEDTFEMRGEKHKYLMVPFKLKPKSILGKDGIECSHDKMMEIINWANR